MPPRLLVGAVFGPSPLAEQFERAGHTVRPLDVREDPGAVAHVDLVLLDGPLADIRTASELVADYARPRQMFLHTALDEGQQLLDEVETSHAITMCAHNLFDNVWVTSAADELGETVVGLLITEIGGVSLRINDQARPLIAAAQELRAMESVVRDDAMELLTHAVPDFEAVVQQFLSAPHGQRSAHDPEHLERLVAAVPGPGTKRLFVDLVRRRGEVDGDTDTELWAIHKYEGG